MKRFAGRRTALVLIPLLAVALGAACLATAPGNVRRSLAANHQHSSVPSKGDKGRSVDVAGISASRRTLNAIQSVVGAVRDVATGCQLVSRPFASAPTPTTLLFPPLRL
jgi:hypothetical protein